MADAPGSIYGPMLIGSFINCILYGATAIQALIYFQTFKRDKWWMKMLVLYLLFCETLNTVLDTGIVYEPLIIRYATPDVSTHAPIMLATNPVTTVMISLPVQLFVAWRVKIMNKSSVLPAIISLFAIASFAGGIAVSVSIIRIDFEYSRFHENDGVVITWLAASAAADVIITASLVHSLLRKRTGFATTDDIIDRIIRLSVQTGLITALSATTDIMLFLLLKGRTWNFVWDLALSKLYSNTILSTLNAREGWKATSTMRDNVLFGNGTASGVESTPIFRTQVEIVTPVTTDQSRRVSGTVPLNVFDSKASYVCDSSSSEINTVPAFASAV